MGGATVYTHHTSRFGLPQLRSHERKTVDLFTASCFSKKLHVLVCFLYGTSLMPSKSLCLPGINPKKNANNAFFLGRRLRSCNLFGNLPIVHQSTIFLFGLACAKNSNLQVRVVYTRGTSKCRFAA